MLIYQIVAIIAADNDNEKHVIGDCDYKNIEDVVRNFALHSRNGLLRLIGTKSIAYLDRTFLGSLSLVVDANKEQVVFLDNKLEIPLYHPLGN